jgi:hypothetical protein
MILGRRLLNRIVRTTFAATPMAKVELHALFENVRGAIGDFVLRRTPHGPVLSRRPDMSKVQWSPAQQARRKLMADAGVHYRAFMADPKQAARYKALAAKKKIPVSSLVMGDYLRRGGK